MSIVTPTCRSRWMASLLERIAARCSFWRWHHRISFLDVRHVDENRAELDQIVGANAYIMGRNMFGPGRGE